MCKLAQAYEDTNANDDKKEEIKNMETFPMLWKPKQLIYFSDIDPNNK